MQEVLTETASLTPQERLDSGIARAIELRSAGDLSGATNELEAALRDARQTPYEVKFQSRVRLATMLTSSYLAANRLEEARLMLAEESEYAEKIFSLIEARGSVAEKRMAMADRVQIRDLNIQLNLIGQPAPEISIETWINSEPTGLADLRGRVVLLEFWATWCKPCDEMFPKLKELHNAHAERGLRTLALTRHYLAYGSDANAREEELGLVRKFIAERDIVFPVGVSADERTQTLYGATGMPAIALIDRRGIVRYRFGGGDALFQQILQECLDE
ncbi:MAG: TlpA family protein disulfide reductase [Pyrinomonadaceae bacterium]|nr:TlpA family protein disulfide reductase [Pyrinomonadaceae bacterium]